jgi:hypothetical protein
MMPTLAFCPPVVTMRSNPLARAKARMAGRLKSCSRASLAGGGLDVVLHALEADPHAGKARQGQPQDAVVEDLLHAGRVQDRHHIVDEGELRLVGAGGALAGVVVAHQGDHPAVLGGAGVVGMAEHVAGAVDAGALAVPDAEHAVVPALAPQLGLLRAPERGGSQVLVQARLEPDVVGLQDPLRAQHRRLEGGDGRASVARHIARGKEPRLLVAGALGQHQAHDRLGARQQLAGLVERVLVVEAGGVLDHREPRRLRLPCRVRQDVSSANATVQ